MQHGHAANPLGNAMAVTAALYAVGTVLMIVSSALLRAQFGRRTPGPAHDEAA